MNFPLTLLDYLSKDEITLKAKCFCATQVRQNHLTLLLLFCGNADQKRPTPHGKIMSAITPLMRRVRESSDLRDTKRADLQPAQQVKRAPLTKEQEGKRGNTRGINVLLEI